MKASDIVIKPIISEKSFSSAGSGSYTFMVNSAANKNEIRSAIESLFGVNVIKVVTMNTKKTKSVATKTSRRQKKFTVKKASVKLKKGEKIDIFEEESTK